MSVFEVSVSSGRLPFELREAAEHRGCHLGKGLRPCPKLLKQLGETASAIFAGLKPGVNENADGGSRSIQWFGAFRRGGTPRPTIHGNRESEPRYLGCYASAEARFNGSYGSLASLVSRPPLAESTVILKAPVPVTMNWTRTSCMPGMASSSTRSGRRLTASTRLKKRSVTRAG